jgi:ADP-ribosylglycohydrolase
VETAPEHRAALAHSALQGLSVGDAFGERFFVHPSSVQLLVSSRALPAEPWEFTDDTQMALSIVAILKRHGAIDQTHLARSFGRHYEPRRGYGPAMMQWMPAVRGGVPWKTASRRLFGGQGSFGNGAAMRVAPIGAYFFGDRDAVTVHAAHSAEVTHAHAEAAAGAIAVAMAAALSTQSRLDGTRPDPREFLTQVLAYTPASEVRVGIERALELPSATSVRLAVEALGNGSRVSAQDTVPFSLWCAAHHLADYEEALWLTVSGLGDRDTTCAIVGGIVACHTGVEGIPAAWRQAREPLPEWDA